MKVHELMQRQVSTIDEDGTLALAAQLMLWREVRHLPVVAGDRVVGILSERDVLHGYADAALGRMARAKDVMHSPVHHVRPNADIADAAADMTTHKLGCVVVMESGKVVGMLTRTDLLATLAQYPMPEQGTTRRAAELMTRDVVTVEADDLLVEAAAKMTAAGIRHLCVVDVDGRLEGVLSDRDVRTEIGNPLTAATQEGAGRRLGALHVSHAMRTQAHTASPGSTVAELLDLFLVRRVGAVPVVDADGKVQGIVSYIDLLRAVAAGVLG